MKNPSSSILASEQGLTLLEILISIALLAFIMLGVVAIVDDSQNTKDRVTQADRDNLQAEVALKRIEADLTQIWSPLYFSRGFQGQLDPQSNPGIEEVVYLYENHPRFRGPSEAGLPIPRFRLREKDDFVFLTTANRRKLEDQRQSHFMWVRYHVDSATITDETSGQEVSTRVLLRQIFPDDPWAKEELNLDGTRSATLLERVESLEFAFWNPSTRKWDTSLSSIAQGESILRGIQVTLKWKDSKDNERTTVRQFRPLWPPVLPNDPVAQPGGGQASAQGGQQGGQPGGAQAGTPGGN